jgi:hypothetical protein
MSTHWKVFKKVEKEEITLTQKIHPVNIDASNNLDLPRIYYSAEITLI